MLTERLGELRARMREYGRDLQPSASEEDIQALLSEVSQTLDAQLPEEYLAFLRISDGLEWNGLSIFGTTTRELGTSGGYLFGFVDFNVQRREFEPASEFLIFGEGGVDCYAYHLGSGEYRVLDRISLDTTESVESFDALIMQALEDNW